MKKIKKIISLIFLIVTFGGCFAPEEITEDLSTYIEVAPYVVGSDLANNKIAYLVKEEGEEEWSKFDGVFTNFTPDLSYEYELKVIKNSIVNLNTGDKEPQYKIETVLNQISFKSRFYISLANENNNWITLNSSDDNFYLANIIKIVPDSYELRKEIYEFLGIISSDYEYIGICEFSNEENRYNLIDINVISK